MKRMWQRRILWAALLAVGVAAAFSCRFFRTQQVWASVEMDEVRGSAQASLEAGDAYGLLAAGPYMDLAAGRYRIKVQLEGDGENEIRLTSSNDAAITPDVFTTQPGVFEHELEFELLEPAHNFSVEVSFSSGTWVNLVNVRLYSPEYTNGAFLVSFLLIAAFALAQLHRRGKLRGERGQALLVLAAAVALASSPCLRAQTPLGHDTQFHMARLMNLADGLHSGQFPVRLGAFSYNGYGALTSVFYPDLLLVPLAGMLLGGASIVFVVNAWWVALNAISAATMYAAARRIWGERWAAVCAAVLYVLAPYRMMDVCERSMMGQAMAMAFLPLFALGLWEVLCGERERWPLLAVGATLIAQSHMLSTAICALAALGAAMVCARRVVRQRRYREILKALGAALLLNLFTLAPMVQTYLSGVTSTVVDFGVSSKALTLCELLSGSGMVGLPLMLTALAALCAGEKRRCAAVLAGAGALCMFIASDLFPWSYAEALLGGAARTLQFPWRFLVITVLCFALCGGYGCVRVLGGRGLNAALLTLALAALPAAAVIENNQSGSTLALGEGANPYMIYPEYQITGTDVADTRSRQAIASDGLTVTQYEKDGSRVTAQVDAQQDASLTLPLFGFEGYRAELNGEEIAWTRGENNRLTVLLPAGTKGELRVWFEGFALWRAADCVSLLSALGLAARALRRRFSVSGRQVRET